MSTAKITRGYKRQSLLRCGVAVAAIGCAVPSYAQGVPPAASDPAPAADNPANTPPQIATPDQAVPTGEIVVTARRRDERLQDTPIAVTSIQPAQLEAKGTLNIGDLQGTAPNLLITQQPTGVSAANISIRGIAFADVEKSFDPAVGIYVDDVYIGTSTGQLLDFFDIASIEVLRGPQGTLFGRNTIAGVITIQRTKPTMQFGGKFEAGYSSYGTYSLKGVVNVPLISDKLGLKLFEMHTETDGYQKDAQTGERLGKSKADNFGVALRLKPTDDFDAILTLEKQRQRFKPFFGSSLVPGDVFCAFVPPGACGGNMSSNLYKVYRGVVPFEPDGKYDAKAATLNANWLLGGVALTSVTSYRESKDYARIDIGTAGIFVADRPQKYHQFSQELRFAGNLMPTLDYVAGLYYFKSHYSLDQQTFVFGGLAGGIGARGDSKSYAAFVDMNWKVTDTIRISGGGRFTKDKKVYEFPLILGDEQVSKSWSKFTPKLSVDYRPNRDVMVYASWSRGYRSGGFSGRAGTEFSASTPYDPETVDSYEAGAKTTLMDGKATFNVAAFHTKYNDIQQSSVITADNAQGNETIVVNAAGAKINGFETDFSLRPIDRLNIRGAIGYTDSKFNGFVIGQPITAGIGNIFLRPLDYSKVDLIFAPKWTLSVNTDYTVPIGAADLTFAAGYRYLSPYDQQIAPDPALYGQLLAEGPSTTPFVVPRNDPRVRTDPQNLVDLSISAVMPVGTSSKARLTAFVRNALNDKGSSFAFAVAAYPNLWHYANPREPRIFGATLGLEF